MTKISKETAIFKCPMWQRSVSAPPPNTVWAPSHYPAHYFSLSQITSLNSAQTTR